MINTNTINFNLLNTHISIYSNDSILLNELIPIYGSNKDHLNNSKNTIFFSILNNKKLYNNSKIFKLCRINFEDNNFICVAHRDCNVILDRTTNHIYAYYYEFNKNVLDFINRLITTTIHIIMEQEGIFIIRASCLEKNGNAIAILEYNPNDSESAFYHLLQYNDFNFISINKLGLYNKENSLFSINIPSKYGISFDTISDYLSSSTKNHILKNPSFRKLSSPSDINLLSNYSNSSTKRFSSYLNKRIYLNSNDIQSIFNSNIYLNHKIDLVIISQYTPNLSSLKITNLSKNDLSKFIKDNHIKNLSSSLSYIYKLFNKDIINTHFLNCEVHCIKIKQNKNTISELNTYISSLF